MMLYHRAMTKSECPRCGVQTDRWGSVDALPGEPAEHYSDCSLIAQADAGEVTYDRHDGGWNVTDFERRTVGAAGFVIDYAGKPYPVRMVRR